MHSYISKKIAAFKKGRRRIIVAVCGAADLGKSYLSNQVVKNLNADGIKTDYLPLDAFLIERIQRLEQGISGYEIAAYKKNRVIEALNNFKKNRAIVYAPYIHSFGKCADSFETIKPGAVLIFDGVQSMHEMFLPYIDFSIFIYTEDEHLKKIRYAADLEKRRYSADLAKSVSASEFGHYQRHIAPYRQKADLVLFLEKKWDYRIRS